MNASDENWWDIQIEDDGFNWKQQNNFTFLVSDAVSELIQKMIIGILLY